MSFLFCTDEVVAAAPSRRALVARLRLEYDEAGEVTHVAVGPEDGMHEVGERGRPLAWKHVKRLCARRHRAVHKRAGRARRFSTRQ